MALTLEQPAWEGTYYSAPLYEVHRIDADTAGLQTMLSGATRVYSRRSCEHYSYQAESDSHWVLFKKKKSFVRKN